MATWQSQDRNEIANEKIEQLHQHQTEEEDELGQEYRQIDKLYDPELVPLHRTYCEESYVSQLAEAFLTE
jgi:hypothetical protein